MADDGGADDGRAAGGAITSGPMTPDRWAAVMAVFEPAVECPPAERARFLDRACAGDPALRREVESLLAAADDAADFLETPAAPSPGALADALRAPRARTGARTGARTDAGPGAAHAGGDGGPDDDLARRLQEALGAAYRVERELGGGGMSRVFVAEEVRLGRRVAVKVLRPAPGTALGAERFLREARLVAGLRHPHVVPLLAAGEGADGLLYYTMPYVEGESLRQRLEREGRLPLGEVAAIVREVADALAYAHARGVVHRDVKPANVLLDGAHALVADFGIAKAAALAAAGRDDPERPPRAAGAAGGAPGGPADGAPLTTAGLVLGTPAYMSPEQAAGGLVDARSDVYSLGCMAFELLTGRRPFADAEAATLARRLADPPPAACARRPDLPAAVDPVLARAFAPLPDARYPGPTELAAALAALAGAPGAGPAAARGDGARPHERPAARDRRPWRPRRRVAAGLAGAAAAAVIAAAVVRRGPAPGAGRAPSGPTVTGLTPRGLMTAGLTTGDLAAGGRPDPGAPAARRTVAVLPFEHAGPADEAYFADGVGDELASRLTSLDGLRVISPRSTREYRDSAKRPAQIGRELGADYLLRGRVRWERPARGGPGGFGAGRVRVTAELVSARDGSAVWADRYAADARDVTDVEGAIGERVAAALELALGAQTRQTLAARPTADFQAYSDYLRGEALRTAPEGSAGAWQQAAASYERAVARDPRFALALARLSEVHSRLHHWNVDPSDRRLARARAAADSAVRLDPALAEGYLALGLYHYYARRDYDSAQAALTRALRLQPGRAELLQARGYVLRRQGRFAEAAASLARAVELDPRSAVAAWDLAETYATMRAYPQAMRYYDRALALAPERAGTYADRAQRLVAWRGDVAAARQVVRAGLARADAGQLVARLGVYATMLLGADPAERAAVRGLTVAAFGHDTTGYLLWRADWARLHGEPARARAYADSARRRLVPRVAAAPGAGGLHVALARAYAGLGRRTEALREGERGVALLPVAGDAIDGPNLLQDLAYVETVVGAHDAAAGHLAELLAIPSDFTVALLRADPRWAPLRGNRRFRQLVGSVGTAP